jgi:hypothetical protein
MSGGMPDAPAPDPRWSGRRPEVGLLMRWFEHGHLAGPLQPIVQTFGALAAQLVENLADDPELTACLRKLIEAKDCAVRAAIATAGHAPVWRGAGSAPTPPPPSRGTPPARLI